MIENQLDSLANQMNSLLAHQERDWKQINRVQRHGSRAAKVLVKRMWRNHYALHQIADATRVMKGHWLRRNWW